MVQGTKLDCALGFNAFSSEPKFTLVLAVGSVWWLRCSLLRGEKGACSRCTACNRSRVCSEIRNAIFKSYLCWIISFFYILVMFSTVSEYLWGRQWDNKWRNPQLRSSSAVTSQHELMDALHLKPFCCALRVRRSFFFLWGVAMYKANHRAHRI